MEQVYVFRYTHRHDEDLYLFHGDDAEQQATKFAARTVAMYLDDVERYASLEDAKEVSAYLIDGKFAEAIDLYQELVEDEWLDIFPIEITEPTEDDPSAMAKEWLN